MKYTFHKLPANLQGTPVEKVRIGLIGTGYIGRCHAIAYAQASTVFSLKGDVVREMVAEVNAELAKQQAASLGFRRSTGDWRELVADPQIDVVDICAPNFLHKAMALEAIRHGKHVYCEKPLALNVADAEEMTRAADAVGVKTLVGFNYIKNPTSQLAKEIIASGEIGEVVHFYGTHNEDYLASAKTPLDWHCRQDLAGLGALGDLGAHIVNMAHFLVGNISDVSGDLHTIIKQRPHPNDPSRFCAVENEDQASALLRFTNGAHGVIETSRIACGSKMGLTYVVTGSKGTLRYSQERMAELALYIHDDPAGRQGFKTILTGPDHPDYANFCISAGHGIGFNDQKTVEIRDLINGIAANDRMWPDFAEGLQVAKVLEAISVSARERHWMPV